jgi:hypothetical protein
MGVVYMPIAAFILNSVLNHEKQLIRIERDIEGADRRLGERIDHLEESFRDVHEDFKWIREDLLKRIKTDDLRTEKERERLATIGQKRRQPEYPAHAGFVAPASDPPDFPFGPVLSVAAAATLLWVARVFVRDELASLLTVTNTTAGARGADQEELTGQLASLRDRLETDRGASVHGSRGARTRSLPR